MLGIIKLRNRVSKLEIKNNSLEFRIFQLSTEISKTNEYLHYLDYKDKNPFVYEIGFKYKGIKVIKREYFKNVIKSEYENDYEWGKKYSVININSHIVYDINENKLTEIISNDNFNELAKERNV